MKKIKVKDASKKPLVEVQGGQCFFVYSGPVLKNLRELGDALGTMSEDTFAYHANAVKNDFASWIKNILADDELAEKLFACDSRENACETVKKWVKKHYQ